MAKQGMKRISKTHTKPGNDAPPVPEIQGKAKHTNKQANPIISGTMASQQKVYHSKPYSKEKPVSSAYKEIDKDLARDNFENDIPQADLQSL